MPRALAALACCLIPAAAALAQFTGGVNLDFNAAAGAGAGQPTILFGGAAVQGGYWNPVTGPFSAGATRTIRDLGNSLDAVTMTFVSTSGAGVIAANNANTSGDTELLIDDLHDLGGAGSSAVYSLGPFAPGVYEVYVYAVAPDSAAYRTSVEIGTAADALQPAQSIGGAIPAGGALSEGTHYARRTVNRTAAGPIVIRAATAVTFGSVNGIQIKRLPVTRLYVNADAPAAGQNGLAWGSAYRELQSALAVAATTPSVAEVWVAGGAYRPDRVLYADGDRAAAFRPRGGLAIIGSFAGTEGALAERANLSAHPTLLTGDLGAAGTPDDNTRNLMYAPVAGGALTLDGLNFVHTFTEESGWVRVDGSALHVGAGAVVIKRCAFRDCAGPDAAVVVDAGGHATITDSLFERNTSVRTAGLRVDGSGSVALVDRCIFRDHTMITNHYGVLVQSAFDGSLTLTNSLLHDNNRRSSAAAGMFVLSVASAHAEIYNCTFAYNTGGGLIFGPAFGGSNPSVVCRNNILWGNRRSIEPDSSIEVQQLRIPAGVTGVSFSDCLVEGWTETRFTGLDNHGLDPRFVDIHGPDGYRGSDDDNYRLASRSPARDSAWHDALPAAYRTLDLSGAPRVVDDPHLPNTGFGSAATPLDRGCYEAQDASAVCPGDVGSQGGIPGPDGLRNNNDFVVFINWFFAPDSRADVGRQGGTPPGDGLYNNNDFIVFIDQFFSFCP